MLAGIFVAGDKKQSGLPCRNARKALYYPATTHINSLRQERFYISMNSHTVVIFLLLLSSIYLWGALTIWV